MPEHTTPDEPNVLAAEPAGITEGIRLIVAALVAVGVIEINDTLVNAVTLAIGGVISIGLTWYTRRKSTPLAKPRTDDGRILTPGSPPGGPPPVPPPPPRTTGDDPAL